MKHIYLDNAAGTPVDPRVAKEIMRGLAIIGNPSAFNNPGREAFTELQKARQSIARFLGAHSEEIIFTASGSEANTLAIRGAVQAITIGRSNRSPDILLGKMFRGSTNTSGRVITTVIEHKSVLEPVRAGHATVVVPVSGEGLVAVSDIEKALTLQTILVSVMYANNEIGTIQPIVAIGKAIKDFRKKHGTAFPLFHVDACQATEYLPMDVNRLGVDLMTLNGSKAHGPRGIGALYVRKGVRIAPQVLGGGQEWGLRAGTENLPAILGFAKALSLIKKSDAEKIARLRDFAIAGIEKALPDAKANGPKGEMRLANNINISIPGLDSEQLLLELDKHGIAAGSGSACTARSVEPSHVLKAIGNELPYLNGALRFSLSRETTKQDIIHLLKVLPNIIKKLRVRYQS